MDYDKEHIGTFKLRQQYGFRLSTENTWMPLYHFLPMALEIQASLTFYKGIKTSKWPCDAWIYQELIFERKPTVIIEIGNFHGGSTVMLADYLDLFSENSRGVIGVDIDHKQLESRSLKDSRIQWVDGDGKSDEVFHAVCALLKPDDRVMVIDDSNHEPDHSYQVLKKFSPLVSVGQYFIMEDTVVGPGNIIPKMHREYGADWAVREFMKDNTEFKIDHMREKWFYTNNVDGFLERIG